jgi:hypothetical protein
MVPNLTHLMTDSSILDSFSVTEIEELISNTPSADLYRVLLDKKMSRSFTQHSVLAGADKMLGVNMIFGNEDMNAIQTGAPDPITEHVLNMEVIEIQDNSVMIAPGDFKSDILDHMEVLEVSDNNQQMVHNEINATELIEPTTPAILERPEVDLVDEIEIEPVDESSEVVGDVIVLNVNNKTPEIYTEKKSDKKKKNKQKNFKLKEYSGISEYAKWLLSFKNVDVEKQILKEEKAAKKRALEQSAKKSVTKSDLIASESLAEILAIQGHFDDAKKMYEQLMHKYPEKSSYFAAKINNLLKI